MKFLIVSCISLLNLLANSYFYYHKGEKIVVTPSFQEATRSADTMHFTREDGKNITVSQRVIAKLREASAPQKIEKKYGVIFLEKLTPTLFLFQTDSPTQALELSKDLVEHKEAEFAHPDFIQKIQRR